MGRHLHHISILISAVLGSYSIDGFTDLTCENWNDTCEPGTTIVDCFVDLCENTNQCADGKLCHMNHCGGCHTICCDPCEDDTFQCPDGSFVGRDPENYCNYFECPSGECDGKPMLCPDGYTFVSQNPENNCEYDYCPPRHVPQCRDNPNICEEGIPMFSECYVEPCSDPGACPEGTTCIKNFCGGCHELCCSEDDLRICGDDTMECPDGSIVRRNKDSIDCSFDPCPSPKCLQDVKVCPDGTSVSRRESTCCFELCSESPSFFDVLSLYVCALFGTGYQVVDY